MRIDRVALALVCASCHAEHPTAGGEATLEALPRARVVVEETLARAPEGGDGPDVVTLAREEGNGERASIRGPALGGAPFLGGALVLRPDRTLEMVRAHGVGSVIDREVVFAPVVSADGEHAAWAAEHGPEMVLVVIDRDGGRFEAARGLASIGAVVFDPSSHGPLRRIAFVAARHGGIAGLWASHVDGSDLSCLTNCALRAGQPLLGEHVPLPSEPLVFAGERLESSADGVVRTVPLPEPLR